MHAKIIIDRGIRIDTDSPNSKITHKKIASPNVGIKIKCLMRGLTMLCSSKVAGLLLNHPKRVNKRGNIAAGLIDFRKPFSN